MTLKQSIEYDDERYLEWCSQFDSMIHEFLNTEGNTEDDLDDLYKNAVENAKDDLT